MLDLDRSQIQSLFDLSHGAAAVWHAYVEQSRGRVQAPPVTYLGFDDANGDCHVKSGFIAGTEGFVIKIATGFYDNPAKGLSSSNGMNLLFSAETGQALAVLRDEGWLTDIRTGLGGALATRALAKRDFTKVLIVGAGLQCRHQARCLAHLIDDRTLDFTIWARNGVRAEEAAQALRDEGLRAATTQDLPASAADAHAIVTTTPATSPIIRSEWIMPGTHITAVGADAPGKQELQCELVARADLHVCDDKSQSLDHGELHHAVSRKLVESADIATLGDILAGSHPGRTSDGQITLADLTGLAAQDAAVSLLVLREATHRAN